MRDVGAAAYERVPYEDRPVAETHPDRLYVAARRAGVMAAHPRQARVLELGCAHAVNLMPMAACLPGARFLGVDLSASQIDLAAVRIREVGLSNLEVLCTDVMDLELGGTRFDYVIAHGLLSWVPPSVADRVLTICRESLAEGGVAYLSYNTLPAWGIRGAVRRALLELLGEVEEPRERIRRAREGLRWLGDLQSGDTPEGALLQEEIAALDERPDAYVLHEYLTPHSHAFWVREFVDRIEAAGLRFVADVAPSALDPQQRQRTLERVRERVGDPIAVEQLLDVVSYRQFRASLVCRSDEPRTVSDPIELLRELHVAAEPEGAEKASSSSLDALLAPVRARWPGDVPFAELASSAPAAGLESSAEALAARLLDAHDAEVVHLRPRALPVPREVPDRPRVSALTRLESRWFPFVTTLLHQCAPLDPFHAALVAHLDGTRDRPDLCGAIAEDIRDGRLQVGGAVAPDALRDAMPRLVDQAITRIFEGALLVE